MQLLLEKAARKGIDKMSAKAAAALLKKLEDIAKSPFGQHANVTALVGEKNAFRLRQGDWRAIYRLIKEQDEMRVVLVDVGGSVYR